LTSPPTKILGRCVPGIPGGVDDSESNNETLKRIGLTASVKFVDCVNDAQPIGGPGTAVQPDKAYMHGRGKNHVGRLMRGNRVASARQSNGRVGLG